MSADATLKPESRAASTPSSVEPCRRLKRQMPACLPCGGVWRRDVLYDIADKSIDHADTQLPQYILIIMPIHRPLTDRSLMML